MMMDKVTALAGHLIFVGRPYFNIGGRNVTPAQLVFNHNFPDRYQPGVPVLSHCGIRNCIKPGHTHPSVLASRYNAAKEA